MSDRDREKRRAKRLEKQRKKRAKASRAGMDGPAGSASPVRGRGWPTGECWVSEGHDAPGARVQALFSRTNTDGATVLAAFEIDRGGRGIVAARAKGGLRREHVGSECARWSEETGVTMLEAAPGLVAALVDDARLHGDHDDPPDSEEAFALLAGVERMALDLPFGPEAAPESPAERPGWFAGIRRRLFG